MGLMRNGHCRGLILGQFDQKHAFMAACWIVYDLALRGSHMGQPAQLASTIHRPSQPYHRGTQANKSTVLDHLVSLLLSPHRAFLLAFQKVSEFHWRFSKYKSLGSAKTG